MLPFLGLRAQPANDDPCNAIALTVGASCTFSSRTNAAATATPGIPAPGCANYNGGDVWFTAVVPANGQLIIDSNTGVVTDGGMALYSATACGGTFTLIECDDDDSANGQMPSITRTGLAPGSTVYIRFWEYGSDNNGTFSICAYSPPPAAPGMWDRRYRPRWGWQLRQQRKFRRHLLPCCCRTSGHHHLHRVRHGSHLRCGLHSQRPLDRSSDHRNLLWNDTTTSSDLQ